MADMVFIDPHCHMFNIVDIPLVSTLQGKIRMGTLERLVTAIAAGAGLVLGLGERLLEHYEDFVRFFERDLETNLRWFALELRQAVTQNGIDAELIVITPLIMDFDLVQATTRIGGDASLQLQLARLEATHRRRCGSSPAPGGARGPRGRSADQGAALYGV